MVIYCSCILQGFYFGSEESFDSWCQTVSKELIQSQKTPIFEVNQFRPAHWPPFEPYAPRTPLYLGMCPIVTL